MNSTKTSVTLKLFVLLAVMIMPMACASAAEKNYFPSFADDHTVGLWLFDETEYPYTTITDASKYEYDLRLMKGGRIVPGKFGNCLKITPGLDPAVRRAVEVPPAGQVDPAAPAVVIPTAEGEGTEKGAPEQLG